MSVCVRGVAMSAEVLGRSVLELTTDQSPLNRGLTEARALTSRQTQAMKADARIELTANLLRLQSDFERARLLTRNAARQADRESAFVLRANLAQFQSDLRTAERERAASLRRMQQQGPASLPGLGEGGPVAGLVAGVAGGATVAALGAVTGGFQRVARAGEEAVGVTLDYNAAIQSATANIKAFTGSQEAVAVAQGIANKQLELGRSGYQATLTALADVTPLARRYGASLQELLTTQQLLAALDPAQGFAGAAIALREALSGDFVSLSRRFEIPRTEIARLKAEGLPNLEIVKRALAGLGITEALLDERAQTFTQRQIIATDTLRKFIAEAGKPIFDLASDGLAGFIRLINDPAFKEGAAKFAGELSKNLNDIRHTFDELRGNADLQGIAKGAGEAASAVGELYDSLEGVRRVVTLGGFERLLTVLHAYSDGVGFVSGGISHLIEIGGRLTAELDRQIEKLREIQKLQGVFGEPAQVVGQRVTQGVRATAPPTEAQFDSSARASSSQRQTALYQQGLADLRAYVDGFSSSQLDLFGKIGPQIHAAFDRAFGDLDISQQIDKGLGGLDTLTARIIDDLRQYGHVSDETRRIAVAALGDQATAVLALADGYGRLARAAFGVQAATGVLAIAQANLNRVQADAATNIAGAEHALEVARGRAQTNQQQFANAVERLQADLAAIGREAASQQRGAEAAQREFQRAIAAAQSQQSAYQEQASRNAAAYAAVLSGTTDEYERQNAVLSEQERQIIANGNAQVRAALAAKTAQDAIVQGLEEKERAVLLGFEERIRAARRKGTPEGDREANALTEQRDREKARLDYQLDLERQRAAVRGDEADTAKKPVEDAAAAQAAEDKKRVDEAGKRVGELQEQASLRAESDRATAQAIADRQTAIQGEITAVQARATVQKVADDAAIVGAQAALTLVQQIEAARIKGAQQGVANAQLAVNTANAEVVAQGRTLALLGQKQTALDKYVDTWKAFVAYLKGENIPVPQFFGAPVTTTTPGPKPGGGVTEGSGEGAAGQSDAPVKDPNRPTVFPPAPPPPEPEGPGFFGRASLPTAPRYRPPVPPRANLAAYGTLGAGGGAPVALSRAGGPTTIHAPLTFPNATFTSDIDVKRAVVEAAELAVQVIIAGLDEDNDGGGSQSNWRA